MFYFMSRAIEGTFVNCISCSDFFVSRVQPIQLRFVGN